MKHPGLTTGRVDYKVVTETDTQVYPEFDDPQGLEDYTRNIDKDLRGRHMTPIRPKLLSPKQRTRIGIWNLRTMYQAGKVHQVAREMQRLNIAVLGISETRWLGCGKTQLVTGETLLYSGLTSDIASHEKGVALLLSQQAAKSLLEWEPISERIIIASFESKCQNTTIIQTYAPTNDAEEDTKEDFYYQLQAAFNKTKRRDLTIVMGDLNAKVGSDNKDRESITGTQGVGSINENGELFCDFCATNGLVIGGILFHHKKSHKVTWRSPDGVTESQIDHVAMKSSLQDTRVKRSADVGSDHHLVIVELKIKLLAIKKARCTRYRYCTRKLRSQGCLCISTGQPL